MPSLERQPLGGTGLEVTRIGFGALEIGRDWGIGDEAARRRPEAEAAGEVLRSEVAPIHPLRGHPRSEPPPNSRSALLWPYQTDVLRRRQRSVDLACPIGYNGSHRRRGAEWGAALAALVFGALRGRGTDAHGF
jgi:hypothetical protein